METTKEENMMEEAEQSMSRSGLRCVVFKTRKGVLPYGKTIVVSLLGREMRME